MSPRPLTASRAAVAGWILFEWAGQPFFTLVTTFVYAPYFAASIVGDPTRGQALWGFATAAAGFSIALLAPALGAIADAAGHRKPWIAGFSALLCLGLGRLSGTAGAIAYVGALISLALPLGFLAGSPTTGKTLLGLAPLFGLDPLAHEGDRATGPFTAI